MDGQNTPAFVVSIAGLLLLGLPFGRFFLVLLRLVFALLSAKVSWPGPQIHDLNPDPKLQHLSTSTKLLFPTLITNGLGLTGGFFYFLLLLISLTPAMRPYIQLKSQFLFYVFSLIVLAGGWMSRRRVAINLTQAGNLLANLSTTAEPRNVDGLSPESAYAIDHPLRGMPAPQPGEGKALAIFLDGTWFHQICSDQIAFSLNNEAMTLDPLLHQHAIARLRELAQNCRAEEEGPIAYWLGAHAEYLHNLVEAKSWYERAIPAFARLGYPKREARVHCNLGSVKMRMNDGSGMAEFEAAIVLNPANGTAHLNIARTYYSICDEGDFRYERALDAFADAIIADPVTYGPQVIASLREIGYTWKADLEKITQRVEAKRRSGAGAGPTAGAG